MATSALQSLENKLNELLVTKAPFQLPDSARKWIATYAWVFAVIGFVLGLFSVLVLLPVLGFVSVLGTAVGAGGYVLFAWLSLIVLIGYVVMLGMSITKLKAMQKSGWNLIFYGTLLYFAYDVFNALQNLAVFAVVGVVWNILVTTVCLYFVFQVRSQFMGKKAAAPAETPAKKA